MIELIVIFNLARSMVTRAQRRGLPAWWGAIAPTLWVVGELMGGVVTTLAGLGYAAYGVALLYAGVGAGIGWLLVEYHPEGRAHRPVRR